MPPTEPSTELESQELRGVLDDELQQLPAKYRVPLVLCYLEGMTNEQAAHRLGWPVGSMSYRLSRGRELLRERLRRRRMAVPALALVAFLQKEGDAAEVSPELADATLRAALGTATPNPPVPASPPAVRDPLAGAATIAVASSFRLRGIIAGVLLLVSSVTAAGAWYVAYGGGPADAGSGTAETTSVADPSTDSSSPVVPTCCH
jgi:RNA polymerase sigma-70 factor (ECF subfamily)